MDEVQAFIARNSHQFGYIMQEASRQWIQKDPVGALTVGDCAAVVKHYGTYGHLLNKVVEQQQEIERLNIQIKEIEKVSDYNADLSMKYEKALERITFIHEDMAADVAKTALRNKR